MLENYGNSRGCGGGGGYDKYNLEIPAGWGCKTKVPSVWGVGGGINIFWNHTIFILSLLCLPKLLIIRC